MTKNLKKIFTTFTIVSSLATSVFAADYGGNNFTQSIQVVNLLANHTLSDTGMTPTGVLIKYFNGGSSPCWSTTLNYQNDATIHAGPTQGCQAKVNMIEIMPLLVADKLKTYQGPIKINIDTSKFASQITIIQEQGPLFDIKTGLVTTPGTFQTRVQAQLKA